MSSLVRAGARVAALSGLLVGCGAGSGAAPTSMNSGGASAGGPSSAGASMLGGTGSEVGGEPASGGGGSHGLGGSSGGAGATGSGGAGGSASAGSSGSETGAGAAGQSSSMYPSASDVLQVLARVNQQFADKWPNPGAPIVVGGTSRESNIWTRAVYYEGLLNLYGVDPKAAYKDYAMAWGTAHGWQLRNDDSTTTNADNQCAGQAYIDLYGLDGAKDPARIAAIQTSIDGMVAAKVTNAWTWIDAIQMSMPVFARLGALRPGGGYFDAMYALYSHPKKTLGLYDTTRHLWWRDANWKAQQSPNQKPIYWSRGNGWVLAALARSLDFVPATDPHRAEYLQDFADMAEALRSLQRSDGFWNPNLGDPDHFGGPESSGTALFVYGMAWGIRQGLLDEASYGPVIAHAWKSLVETAVRGDGFVGFMQSTGDDPSDGQPLTADKVPDFEDYGVGCVLLAGSELAKLASR